LEVKVLTASQKAYRKYLLTDHWKALRERALERDGRKCTYDLGDGFICEDTDRLNVHHVVYREKWEDTRLEDLQTICRTCHRIEHGLAVKFDFDWLYEELNQTLTRSDPFIYPTVLQEKQLVDLALDEQDEWKVKALFRMCAGLKIGNYGSDRSRQLEKRLWPWAERKLKRIKKENIKNPPERYVHVWKTLRKPL
jgi:hypothetical protein